MLLFIIFLVMFSFFFFKKSSKKKGLQSFPEPPRSLLFGNTFDISSTEDIIQVTSKYVANHGNTFRAYIGPPLYPFRTVLLTQDYKFIEFLLGTNKVMSKAENYVMLKDWLGNGLLLSDGAYWKKHRKILTPAFHFEILKEFIETFERAGTVLVEKMTQRDGECIDLVPLITLCTLDIICETAMGTKLNVQSGENTHYVKSVKNMCQIAIRRCYSPLKLNPYTYWMTQDYYTQNKALDILHNFTLRVINSKKGQQTNCGKKKMAFLDLLLKYSNDENVLNRTEVQEEVDTFMFEGHDTTSSGICFTLYCLANNPEVQERVFQEQKELFDDEKNPKITFSELQEMKYLEYVIKETFRLYPPVPLLGRCTSQDVEFENHFIPKGTNIGIFIYGIHRNPEYFPNPEKFDPDRFESFNGSLPFAYIPFSAGSRNCIGQKFAMLELKSIISKIVRNFEIRATIPRHKVKLSVETVLKSVNGIKVKLIKRSL